MNNDNLNQLGKTLGKSSKQSQIASKRNAPITPQIERVRDVFDFKRPFDLEFTVNKTGQVLLGLTFLPAPKVGCCADCSCAVCQFFDGGTSETLYELTYAYVPTTAHVFINNEPSTQFVETAPELGHITVYAHNNDKVVICYVYDVCLGGSTLASFPSGCKLYIDNVDCTYWLFGSDTITPTELKHRWHDIDISQYVKSPGLHQIKITAEDGVGRVDARVALS